MNTQHIGAAGEFLVQYQLLKIGIDSARLTTDAGIDLVVYASADRSALTVQIKANLGPKPSGDEVRLAALGTSLMLARRSSSHGRAGRR